MAAESNVQVRNLYLKRDQLKQQLAATVAEIKRCPHGWHYHPVVFEGRDGAWARVSHRECTSCGMMCERIDKDPNGPLGDWNVLPKFKDKD